MVKMKSEIFYNSDSTHNNSSNLMKSFSIVYLVIREIANTIKNNDKSTSQEMGPTPIIEGCDREREKISITR